MANSADRKDNIASSSQFADRKDNDAKVVRRDPYDVLMEVFPGFIPSGIVIQILSYLGQEEFEALLTGTSNEKFLRNVINDFMQPEAYAQLAAINALLGTKIEFKEGEGALEWAQMEDIKKTHLEKVTEYVEWEFHHLFRPNTERDLDKFKHISPLMRNQHLDAWIRMYCENAANRRKLERVMPNWMIFAPHDPRCLHGLVQFINNGAPIPSELINILVVRMRHDASYYRDLLIAILKSKHLLPQDERTIWNTISDPHSPDRTGYTAIILSCPFLMQRKKLESFAGDRLRSMMLTEREPYDLMACYIQNGFDLTFYFSRAPNTTLIDVILDQPDRRHLLDEIFKRRPEEHRKTDESLLAESMMRDILNPDWLRSHLYIFKFLADNYPHVFFLPVEKEPHSPFAQLVRAADSDKNALAVIQKLCQLEKFKKPLLEMAYIHTRGKPGIFDGIWKSAAANGPSDAKDPFLPTIRFMLYETDILKQMIQSDDYENKGYTLARLAKTLPTILSDEKLWTPVMLNLVVNSQCKNMVDYLFLTDRFPMSLQTNLFIAAVEALNQNRQKRPTKIKDHQLHIIKKFLSQHPDFAKDNERYVKPLACTNEEIFQLMIKQNVPWIFKSDVLHAAILYQMNIDLFLQKCPPEFKINEADFAGITPLIAALSVPNTGLAKTLIDKHGADPVAAMQFLITPGHEEAFKDLAQTHPQFRNAVNLNQIADQKNSDLMCHALAWNLGGTLADRKDEKELTVVIHRIFQEAKAKAAELIKKPLKGSSAAEKITEIMDQTRAWTARFSSKNPDETLLTSLPNNKGKEEALLNQLIENQLLQMRAHMMKTQSVPPKEHTEYLERLLCARMKVFPKETPQPAATVLKGGKSKQP